MNPDRPGDLRSLSPARPGTLPARLVRSLLGEDFADGTLRLSPASERVLSLRFGAVQPGDLVAQMKVTDQNLCGTNPGAPGEALSRPARAYGKRYPWSG